MIFKRMVIQKNINFLLIISKIQDDLQFLEKEWYALEEKSQWILKVKKYYENKFFFNRYYSWFFYQIFLV